MPVTRSLSDHGVLTLALARPERRNAIDGEMAAALRAAFEAAADDPEVRAVILTGEGKAFSAGGDLSRFERDWDPRDFRHDSHRLTSLITLLERLEKPTVAAINGAVTGAGTQLALVCESAWPPPAPASSTARAGSGSSPATAASPAW
jgi:enoyl-CoA hydratase/carnithine racemase